MEPLELQLPSPQGLNILHPDHGPQSVGQSPRVSEASVPAAPPEARSTPLRPWVPHGAVTPPVSRCGQRGNSNGTACEGSRLTHTQSRCLQSGHIPYTLLRAQHARMAELDAKQPPHRSSHGTLLYSGVSCSSIAVVDLSERCLRQLHKSQSAGPAPRSSVQQRVSPLTARAVSFGTVAVTTRRQDAPALAGHQRDSCPCTGQAQVGLGHLLFGGARRSRAPRGHRRA